MSTPARHRRPTPGGDVPASAAAASGRRPGLDYLPQLDGLRALAISMVLLLHASVTRFPGGWIGVHVFFVLSGYLITTLLLREWDRTRTIGLRRFYLRRILRLVPAYWVVLMVFALTYVVSARPSERPALWHEFWVAATYRTNFMFDDLPHLGFTWTLAMEEQFYLVWPLVLLGLFAAGLSRRQVLSVTCLLCAAVVVWRGYLCLTGSDYSRLDTGPDVQADALLVGCIAAQLGDGGRLRRLVALPVVPWLGLVVVAGWVLTIGSDRRWLYAGPLTVVCLVLALMILNLIQRPGPVVERVLASRWPVLLGKISYSLYLWNVFGLELARHTSIGAGPATVLGLLLGVLAAIASYRLVELPFRRLRSRLVRPEPAAAPAF